MIVRWDERLPPIRVDVPKSGSSFHIPRDSCTSRHHLLDQENFGQWIGSLQKEQLDPKESWTRFLQWPNCCLCQAPLVRWSLRAHHLQRAKSVAVEALPHPLRVESGGKHHECVFHEWWPPHEHDEQLYEPLRGRRLKQQQIRVLSRWLILWEWNWPGATRSTTWVS